MKTRVKVDTKGGGVALFFPDQIPADAQPRLKEDPSTVLEILDAEKAWIGFPDAECEGEYELLVLIDENVPSEHRKWCGPSEDYGVLNVKGLAYLIGTEYFFETDDWHALYRPEGGTRLDVPEGTYSARVYSFSPDVTDEYLDKHASRSFKAFRVLKPFLVVFAILWVIAGVQSWSDWHFREWLLVFVVPSLVLIALVFLVGWFPRQGAMRESINRLNKELPDYVLKLTTQNP